jgi:hypothetical protein
MGGFNSGSQRRSFVARSDELLRLSLRQVAQAIDLRATHPHVGPGGPGMVEIEVIANGPGYLLRRLAGYRTRNSVEADRYAVPIARWGSIDSMFVELASSPGTTGGTRFWFVCPRSTCARRCTVLYRAPDTNARAFVCRRCARFRYATQLLGASDSVGARVDALVRKVLVAEGGALVRPKGMHHRTFRRITEEISRLMRAFTASSPLMRHLNDTLESLECMARRHVAVQSTTSERLAQKRVA